METAVETDKRRRLYDSLTKEGYDLPDYATFSSDMADTAKAERLHSSLTSEGYDLPDFKTFHQDIASDVVGKQQAPSPSLPAALAGRGGAASAGLPRPYMQQGMPAAGSVAPSEQASQQAQVPESAPAWTTDKGVLIRNYWSGAQRIAAIDEEFASNEISQEDDAFARRAKEATRAALMNEREVLSKAVRPAESVFKKSLDETVARAVKEDEDLGYLKQDLGDGKLRPSPHNVMRRAKELAAASGMQDDDAFVKLLAQRLYSHVEVGIIAKDAEKVFKEQSGEWLKYKRDERKASVMSRVEEEKAKANLYQSEAASRISAQAKSEGDAINAAFAEESKAWADAFNAQASVAAQQRMDKTLSELQQQVNAGAVSVEQANAMLKAEGEKIDAEAAADFNKQAAVFTAKAQQALNAVNTKYNRMYAEEAKRVVEGANKRISAAVDAAKAAGISADEEKEFKQRWEAAWNKAASNRGLVKEDEAEAKRKAFRAMAKMEFGPTIGPALGDMVNSIHSIVGATTASMGNAIKSFANSYEQSPDWMRMDSGTELTPAQAWYAIGQNIENQFETKPVEAKEFKQYLDPIDGPILLGQFIGGTLPSIVAGGTAAAMTGGAGTPAVIPLLTSAIASHQVETMQISGDAYGRMLEKTGDPSKARKAWEDTYKAQAMLAPAYAFEGLPFVGKALRGVPTRVGRVATGAAAELIPETIQETFQQIADKNIMEGRDPYENVGAMFDEMVKSGEMKSLMVAIAPAAILGGAPQVASQSRKSALEEGAKAYIAKAKVAEYASSAPDQWINGMVAAKGKDFAGAVIGSMYGAGQITQQQAEDLMMKRDRVLAYRDEASRLNLSDSDTRAYVALSAQMQALQQEAAVMPDGAGKKAAESRAQEIGRSIDDFVNKGKRQWVEVGFGDGKSIIMDRADAMKALSDPSFIAMAAQQGGSLSIAFNGDGMEKIADEFRGKVMNVEDVIERARQRSEEERARINDPEAIARQRERTRRLQMEESEELGGSYGIFGEMEDAARKPAQPLISDEVDPEVRDRVIRARQELGVSFDPMNDLPESVVIAFERAEDDKPVSPFALDAASDWLYKKYKQVVAMRDDPERELTLEQIDQLAEQLGKDIQFLEDYKAKLKEDAAAEPAKAKEPEGKAAPVADTKEPEKPKRQRHKGRKRKRGPRISVNGKPIVQPEAEPTVTEQPAETVAAVGEEAVPAEPERQTSVLEGLTSAALQEKFGYAPEVADATVAIADAMGLDKSKIKVVKGGDTAPDALFQEEVDGWYSRLDQAVSAKGSTMPASQWKTWLEARAKEGMLSLEEAKWTGLNDFLASKGNEKVTPQQVREFLKENRVKVEVKVLGAENEMASSAARDEAYNSINEAATRADYYEGSNERKRLDEVLDAWYNDPTERNKSRLDEVVDDLNLRFVWDIQTGDPTKFSQYQLPGGTRYREVLVTLPDAGKEAVKYQVVGAFPGEFATREEALAHIDKMLTISRQPGMEAVAEKLKQFPFSINEYRDEKKSRDFRSSHFDEPNILFHLRVNDRTDADGKKVLFIEEIQSDWAQKGRKEGFSGERSRYGTETPLGYHWEIDTKREGVRHVIHQLVEDRTGNVVGEGAQQRDALKKAGFSESLTPPAPFVTSTGAWVELGLKQAIRMAVDGGYDKIAWANGAQQVNHYREALQKNVDRIEWTKTPEGIQLLGSKNGVKTVDTTESESALSDAIGKSMGDKIINDPGQNGVIEGDDITISDTGMAGFYDKILPTVAKKVSKKLGGNGAVQDVSIKETGAQQSIAITPEMRAKVQQGVPLMQDAKGAVEFAEGGDAIIRALQNPDPSTGIHELSHVARRFLLDRNVPQENRLGITDAHIETAEQWSGAKDGNWTREAEEKFARGFERYLRDGNAPSEELKGLFEKFAQWLREIYQNLFTSPVKEMISPEMRKVFDALVTRGQKAKGSAVKEQSTQQEDAVQKPETEGMGSYPGGEEGAGRGSSSEGVGPRDQGPKPAEEGGKKEQVAKPISEAAKSIADRIRAGKLKGKGLKSTVPGFEQAWDAALEAAALTVEAGGTIAQAASDAVAALRASDWWKSASDKEKDSREAEVIKHVGDSAGEPEKKAPEGMGRRATPKRILEEYPELEGVLDDGILFYHRMPLKVSEAAARALIEEAGADNALKALIADESLPGATKAMLGRALAAHYRKEGRIDKMLDVIDEIAPTITDAAQLLSSLRTIIGDVLDKEALLFKVSRDVAKQRREQEAAAAPRVRKVAKGLRDINKETAEKVADDPEIRKKVQKAAKPKADPSLKEEVGKAIRFEKNKVVTKQRMEELRKILFTMNSGVNPLIVEYVAGYVEAGARTFDVVASRVAKELGRKALPYMKEAYKKAFKYLSDRGIEVGEMTPDNEIDEYLWKKNADRIVAKLESAIKRKDALAEKKALEELQEISREEGLWGQYKKMAADRLKRLSEQTIAKDISEDPSLEEFTRGLVANISAQLKEAADDAGVSKPVPKKRRAAIEIISEAFKNPEKYQEAWDATIKQAVDDVRGAKSALTKAIESGDQERIDKARERVDWLEQRNRALDAYFGEFIPSPLSDRLVKEAVSKGLKDLDIKISEIIKQHWTVQDAAKRSLSDKLVADAGLSEQEAKSLSDAVIEEFDRIATEKKRQLIARAFSTKERAARKKYTGIEQKFIELSNAGVFSDHEAMRKYAEAAGFSTITPEQMAVLEALGDEIQRAPEGRPKNDAIQDFLDYQANVQGVSFANIVRGMWYANILSGPETQMANMSANAAKLITEGAVASIREATKGNPKAVVDFAKIAAASIPMAWSEAKAVWKTGRSPIRNRKIEASSDLERLSRDPSAVVRKIAPVLSNWKYVRRFMEGTDTFFYEIAKESRSYQWALKKAREDRDPSMGLHEQALQILNMTDTARQEAVAQADAEYQNEVQFLRDSANDGTITKSELKDREALAELNHKRRVFELIERKREQGIREEGARFASGATYNRMPSGAMGGIVRGLEMITKDLPLLRTVVPFIRVPANVANDAIDFTPIGFLRSLTKAGSISGKPEKLTPEQAEELKADLRTRALIGTTMMAAAFMLSAGDDDDPPVLEITANGYGDFRKNQTLRERKEGWQPYSIRIGDRWISYQYTPMILAFGMIGHLRDAERYRKKKIDDTAMSNVWAALSYAPSTFFDMSFLQGISKTLGSAVDIRNENKVDDLVAWATRMAKSTVVPNAYTQGFRIYQNLTDTPNKDLKGGGFGNEIVANLLKDMPMIRDNWPDQVNALGEPIIPHLTKFTSGPSEDGQIWSLMASKGYAPTPPAARSLIIYDTQTGRDRIMTPEERHEYYVKRGGYAKEAIQGAFDDLSGMTNKEFESEMRMIFQDAGEAAKDDLGLEPRSNE